MKPRLKVLFLVVALLVASYPQIGVAETIEELRAKLDTKRKDLESTEEKINQLRADIQEKRSQARTLQDQIELLDSSIVELETRIDRTGHEIEEKDIEIETTEAEISEREAEMRHQKDLLSTYIRELHDLDQQSAVTVFLKYETFSDAVQEAETFEELQSRGQEALVAVKQLRDELQAKKDDLEEIRETLEELQTRQEREQNTLAAQRGSKNRILDLTNAQEDQFQKLLKDAQRTHLAAQATIQQLEAAYREKLTEENLASVGVMSWPIKATFGISCGFHCAGYPYAYLIGPHSGIDIPANVGTPIKAPADAIVARAHDSGGPGYSYILLVHKDGISSVFGHVSSIAVSEGDIVTRGDTIGYTGGAAGARGSGLSTGPHLHFEVRENGTAVNPMKYL